MLGLGVLLGEEHRASGEVEMLELDANELTDTAAKLVDYLKHQAGSVIVNAVEELLEFLVGQIAYYLAKTLVFVERFHICRFGRYRGLFCAGEKGILRHFLHIGFQM